MAAALDAETSGEILESRPLPKRQEETLTSNDTGHESLRFLNVFHFIITLKIFVNGFSGNTNMRMKQNLVSIENSETELWPSCENTLLTELRNQKAHGRLCDVIFIHEDVEIYSHACVLASFSPYMMKLLCEYRDNLSIKTPLRINLTNVLKQHEHVCYHCFKNIIDYMYTSEINIHGCHLKHVEYAAKLLHIPKLIDICIQHSISENKTTTTDNNAHSVNKNTKNIELTLPGVDFAVKNSKCFEYIYNSMYQKEMHSTVHSKGIVNGGDKSKFLPKMQTITENQKMNLENTIHILSPINYIQPNSLCERPNTTSKSGTCISTSYNELKKKENTEKSGYKFICDICQYRTSDLYMMLEHLENNNHNQTHCSICTCIFKDNNEFKTHLKVHKEKIPFPCLTCDRKFIKLSNFKKHLLNHSNEKPSYCSICNKTFKLPHSYSRHMIKKHNKNKGRKYCCENCSYSALTKTEFFAHLNDHHTALSMFKCSIPNCEFKTARKDNLTLHNKRKHLKSSNVSNGAFSDKKILNQHVSQNHYTDSLIAAQSLTPTCDIIQIKCNKCNYCTTKEGLYRKHIRKWHGENIKTRENNPVFNTGNSVVTLSSTNNSLQLTEKNNAKANEMNSRKQNSVERGSLISNSNNSIGNKHVISIPQHQGAHIDKNLKYDNENNLLPMSNNKQLKNIYTEQEGMFPADNNQETNITNTVLTLPSATNGTVLLWNRNVDHENSYYSLPLMQPTAEGHADDFQFNSTENNYTSTELAHTEVCNIETQLMHVTSAETEEIFDFNSIEDSGCNRLNTTCPLNSFSNKFSINTSNNSTDENSIGNFMHNIHYNEEVSPVTNLQSTSPTKNVNKIFSKSTNYTLVCSRNNGNELIRSRSNNINYNTKILFTNQEQSQYCQSGFKDPCMSDGFLNTSHMEISTSDVIDNEDIMEFLFHKYYRLMSVLP